MKLNCFQSTEIANSKLSVVKTLIQLIQHFWKNNILCVVIAVEK